MKLIVRLIQISLVLAFAAIPSWAQTSNDLKSRYGVPFKAYEIRPGIMMTVKFNKDGQASEMRIERHAATDPTVHLDTKIPPDLSKQIVDELVPVAERGAEAEFSGTMIFIGGSGTSTDDYENVAITYYTSQSKECSGLIAIVIKWKNRTHSQR